jgi:hypothetical protein
MNFGGQTSFTPPLLQSRSFINATKIEPLIKPFIATFMHILVHT